MRRRAALIFVCLALAGCGPHPPLELSVRDVAVNILLGAQKHLQQLIKPSPTPAPTARPPVRVGPGQATPGPSATPTIIPVPSALPCPSAAPFSFPDAPATSNVVGQPAAGRYPFRNVGSFQPDTSTKTVFAFPPDTFHDVAKPVSQPVANAFTYDVKNYNGGIDGKQTVTTSFLVQPTNPTDAGTGTTSSQAAGIYITSIVTDNGHGAVSTFRPSPPVIYLELPVTFGLAWDTAGSDGGTTLTLHSAIDDTALVDATRSTKGHRVVDACGTLIDSWQVHATGSYVTPTQKLSVDLLYDVATHLGGLTVQDGSTWTGSNAPLGPTVFSANTATTSSRDPGH